MIASLLLRHPIDSSVFFSFIFPPTLRGLDVPSPLHILSRRFLSWSPFMYCITKSRKGLKGCYGLSRWGYHKFSFSKTSFPIKSLVVFAFIRSAPMSVVTLTCSDSVSKKILCLCGNGYTQMTWKHTILFMNASHHSLRLYVGNIYRVNPKIDKSTLNICKHNLQIWRYTIQTLCGL